VVSPGDDPGPFLALLVGALDQAGVQHMLVGSFASSIHGTPRATRDIDIVIDPTTQGLDRLLSALAAEDVYVDPNTAREEFARKGQFNVIEGSGHWKADLIYGKPAVFTRAQFERRKSMLLLNVPVFVASAEDTILTKLSWAKLGASEQQLRDVRGIIDVQADKLDGTYIERWLDALGVRELWERVQDK